MSKLKIGEEVVCLLKDFKKYISEKKENLQLTGSQIKFMEVTLNIMEKDKRLFDIMIQVGDMAKPFEYLQKYCRENLREKQY